MSNLASSRRLVLSILGVVAMLSILFSSVYFTSATRAASPTLVFLPNSAPIKNTAAKTIRHHTANDTLTVGVVLQLSDPAGQRNLLKALYAKNSSSYHAWLTSQQFANRFAPSAADSAAAKSFLTSAGLHLVASDSPTLLLAQGTTTQVEATFHTGVADYALPDGTAIYANSSEVAVPTNLASKVVAVLGLSNIGITAPHKQPARKLGGRYGAGPNGTGLSASQISGIYNIDPVYKKFKDQGKGETIALFEQSNYLPSDIHNYTKAFDLPYTHLVNISVLGGTTDHSAASDSARCRSCATSR